MLFYHLKESLGARGLTTYYCSYNIQTHSTIGIECVGFDKSQWQLSAGLLEILLHCPAVKDILITSPS